MHTKEQSIPAVVLGEEEKLELSQLLSLRTNASHCASSQQRPAVQRALYASHYSAGRTAGALCCAGSHTRAQLYCGRHDAGSLLLPEREYVHFTGLQPVHNSLYNLTLMMI